jgi:prevent-host-death family protein
MKKVSVAILKENLSKYLHDVEAGEELVVTSHHRPVAKMIAYDHKDILLVHPTRPIRDLKRIKRIQPIPGLSADKLLEEDRQKR